MKKYVVQVPEVWMRYIEVQAFDEFDAYEKVDKQLRKIPVDSGNIEYSHTKSISNWDAEEIQD